MPSLSRITSTFFVSLINRLGVRPPPPEGFQISNVVQPVSIVDTDILIPLVVSPAIFGTPATAGEQAAPAANTVLADTGPLAAGNWTFIVNINFSDASASFCRDQLQHRDAANAANIWSQTVYPSAVMTTTFVGQWTLAFSKTMLASERLRVLNLVAGGASSFHHATIFALQL